MALSNRDGRASAIGVNEIYTRVYPNPDGSFNEADRMHIGLSYRFGDETEGPTPDHDYQHQGIDLGMIGYKRSWSN